MPSPTLDPAVLVRSARSAQCSTPPARSCSTIRTRRGRQRAADTGGRAVAAGPLGGWQDVPFTIRSGFRFSPPSNQPVTAQTFKATIERTLNPGMEARWRTNSCRHRRRSRLHGREGPHISGSSRDGDTLTIHLLAPEPDFLSLIAEPEFCAVPSNTPVDRAGCAVIPSAGPVLRRVLHPRPGGRAGAQPKLPRQPPAHFARIEVARWESQTSSRRRRRSRHCRLHRAEARRPNLRPLASRLAARYGPGSAAAARGQQQYFVRPWPELDFLYLNTHRPLFSDVRLRQAVNYAIDRRALAGLGGGGQPLPEQVNGEYLRPASPDTATCPSIRSPQTLQRHNELAAPAGQDGGALHLQTGLRASRRKSSRRTRAGSDSTCTSRHSQSTR